MTIHKQIKEILESLPQLTGTVFPIGADLGSVDAPIAVYTVKGPEPVRVLSGKVIGHTMTVTVDFLCATYDECVELFDAAETALFDADMEGVISLDIEDPGEEDSYIDNLRLYAKRMAITIESV